MCVCVCAYTRLISSAIDILTEVYVLTMLLTCMCIDFCICIYLCAYISFFWLCQRPQFKCTSDVYMYLFFDMYLVMRVTCMLVSLCVRTCLCVRRVCVLLNACGRCV